MLTYNGSTEGMTDDQQEIFRELSSVMNENTITDVLYDKSTTITDNSGNINNVMAAHGGGALVVLANENPQLSKNIILIDPSLATQVTVYEVTSVYYSTPIDAENGARFKKTSIQTNVSDATFHELGHVIYQGQPQDKVIDFNNRVRKILNLPQRPYDETHNKKVIKANY